MIPKRNFLNELKTVILKEKKTIHELSSLYNHLNHTQDPEEEKMILRQIYELKESFKKSSARAIKILEHINLLKPLTQKPKPEKKEFSLPSKPVHLKQKITKKITPKLSEIKKEVIQKPKKTKNKGLKADDLENQTLRRLKKKEKKEITRRIGKPSKYVEISNKMFSKYAKSLAKKMFFYTLERDLAKSGLQYTTISYISVILFTTLVSLVAGILILGFFLFFNLGSELPIITRVSESVGTRILKVFWIPFIVPLSTFFFMYLYPGLEKKSAEVRINRELPFATIHMSAISGSMVEPSKIFNIIIMTKEYPYLRKEFIKLINEINIYGYDLATALRNVAFNNPSPRLADLLNGLATTINSGGDLPEFFEKRAQSLLFEHRIEREKDTKIAESFMDIYISVVIAAPMILMLLLMMMSISGLSWLSPAMVTLIMVLGVSIVNIIFLTFLHLRGSPEQ